MLSAWRKKRRHENGLNSHRVSARRRKLTVEGLESRHVLSTVTLGVIEGSVFVDNNVNNIEDAGEEIANATVELYLDSNANGRLDSGEPLQRSETTDAAGDYTFGDLAPGNYVVVQPAQSVGGSALAALSRPVTIGAGGVTGAIIDSFNTLSGPTIDTNTGGFTEVNHTAAEAIGGERDFLAEVTSGDLPQDSANVFANQGVLSVANSFDATARYLVTWDGADAPNLGVNHLGLGGVDLTVLNGVSGNATGICLQGVQVDHADAVIRLRVYTAANQFSEASITNFTPFVAQDVFIPFTGTSNGISFVNSGLSGQNAAADFTNVGAVSLEIASDQRALDGRLRLINAVGPVRAAANFQNAAPVPNIRIEKSTNGSDADIAGGVDVPVITTGAEVTWTYVVTNTGEAALTTVNVTDDQEGPITNIISRAGGNQDNVLDPGESWTYQETGVAQTGAYENEATVTGSTASGIDVMDTDLSHYLGALPQIDIEKSTNGSDADTAGGADVPNIDVGDQVTWTYTVTNTGTIDLQNVVVTDDIEGNIGTIVSQSLNSNAILEVGEVWTYREVGLSQAGAYENQATVNATSTAGQPVTDRDFSHYVGTVSGIDIEKLTNGNQAERSTDADVPQVFVGEQVTFTYVVTNIGTVPVTDVVVVDDNGTPANTADDFSPTFQSGDIDNDLALDVTETWRYSATRNVTEGLYTNVADVTGRDPNQVVVANSDPSNHVGIEPPPVFGKRRFLASSFP